MKKYLIRTSCLIFECTRGHGFARGISQVYVLDWAWIFRWRRKVLESGEMVSLYAFSHWYVFSFFSYGGVRDFFLIFCDCFRDADGSVDQGASSFVGGVLPFPRDVGDSGCLSVFRGNLGVFPLFRSA